MWLVANQIGGESSRRESTRGEQIIISLSTMASQHIRHVRDHREIVKSPEDKRRYRGLELNNGLKILLVSHMMDPRDIQGLAHFCEHMLFLGTEKYQEENAYSKFLNEHGGSSNAYTSSEHTNFFFDVAPEHLDGALDRFAQFFLCPLFTESASDREVNAVNSENDKNLQSDPWRLHQLEKSLADPQHDFSKFGTDSLDELCELVVPLFANVQNKNVTVPEWTSHPFGTEQLKTICYAIPVKDIRNLSLSWSIPDLHAYYQSNPGHYLGHLIGHEGSGWVNTLCGGQSGGANGFMFFKVDVDLTEEGLEHIDDIITLTYQYINMLKKDQPQEWVFKECQDLSAMTFRFKDKEKPRAYAQHLSSSLHEKYPMQEVLSGPYLLSEFRPDLINMILELLTPNNMSECGLHENLKLPARNEFITTNFDLVPHALNEYAYDAEIASLHYSLDCTIYGMSLSVRGYNEKQHVLLKKILEKLTSFKADPKRFEIWKEMYSRSLKNFNAEQPHQHAIYYTSVLMSEVYWTKEELLEALDDITNAIDISNMVEDILQEQSGSKPLLQSQRKRIREVQLPHGCYYVYENTNKVHKSSSVEIYYQCCMQETQSNMLLELFVQVIGEPAFNILRTKEQLGYIVFTGMRRASGVQGLRIIVQSDKTPQYVESRVEAFLVSMEKYLEEMTEDAFQKHVSALAAKRMEKPKKIFVQHQRYWGEIVSQQYNFERDEVEVSFLKTITKDDLKKFFKDVIAFGAPKRHKLSVHPIVITNVSEFKRDMGLYPLPKPFIDIHKSKSKL
ncbi:hypothetical protein KUTeg_005210 [Tegillarca granosa]|uniref:Insulin-degrading enzyme n=1 Tax=Tegillarca granosa TaxID=220873 RepID=A0ABQ9FM96_TEGGR|nr:hypothetical protein KUTeg_005210 [Tegillarca granosa]